MKRRLLVMFLLVFSLFTLISCATNNEGPLDTGSNNESSDLNYGEELPDRKIIYNVFLTLYTKDLKEAIFNLKENVNSDEWFDEENIQERKASFTIRIKSNRLEQFISDINNSFDVDYYKKTAKDISLEYLDATNEIAAYEAERDRLMVLYESASINDMININSRIGQIDKELLRLEGTLNNFDSLVDYSEVHITINQSKATSRGPFFNRLGTAFMNGLKAFVFVLDRLMIIISTLLPFIIVLVPAGIGTYYLVRHFKRKKGPKDPEDK